MHNAWSYSNVFHLYAFIQPDPLFRSKRANPNVFCNNCPTPSFPTNDSKCASGRWKPDYVTHKDGCDCLSTYKCCGEGCQPVDVKACWENGGKGRQKWWKLSTKAHYGHNNHALSRGRMHRRTDWPIRQVLDSRVQKMAHPFDVPWLARGRQKSMSILKSLKESTIWVMSLCQKVLAKTFKKLQQF